MTTILPHLRCSVKQRLLKNLRCCRDAGTRTRYLILFKLQAGRTPEAIASFLGIHRDTVYRVAKRFRERGEPGLAQDEVAVYEDEVDIHLNPKIGYDWTGYGQQKEVVTPGQNLKRYLAGALDVCTGAPHYVEGEHKDSWLFVRLPGKLYLHYPQAKVIHVILDNYSIHDSQLVAWGLLEAGGRIKLHPLPPYCPNDNKIERVWQHLHAGVTRNHSCPDMDALLVKVRHHLQRRCQQVLDYATSANQPLAEVS